MTKKKQSRLWVDSRHVRPAGWYPPKMTEKGHSRLFESFEGGQRKILIAGNLPSLHGAVHFAYQCHLFYTDNLSPNILLGKYWSPWQNFGEVSTIIQGLLPYVEADIQEFCKTWLTHIQTFDDLNRQCANALASFFNLGIPTSPDDFQVLQNRVELYRKEKGASWGNSSEFQLLISQLDLTITKMEELIPRLEELIQSILKQISPDDFQALAGNQKVKDRIEASREEPNHKRAINMLNRILKQSPTQIQESEIYMELGFRYAELGETVQAIENYTNSIDLAKLPNALVYFWRGELYYREKKWDKAMEDFEQAIALEIYMPEREQAVQYISELQSR